MKTCFNRLRNCAPDLAGRKNVSKGCILQRGKEIIQALQAEEEALETELRQLREENQRLKSQQEKAKMAPLLCV